MSSAAATTTAPRPVRASLPWWPVLRVLLGLLGAAYVVVWLPGMLPKQLWLPEPLRLEWLPGPLQLEERGFQRIFSDIFNIRFIAQGLMATVLVSLIAIVVSLPIATALALGRLSSNRLIRWPCVAIIEVIRALPLILLIFFIHLRFPGLNVFEKVVTGNPTEFFLRVIQVVLSPAGMALMLALTLYTAAVNAELLRSGILSLDRGQNEAARSLGLTYWQATRRVILPQAFRRTVAPLIAQFTILVKDTSLGSIIGFIELQRSAQIIAQVSYNLLEAYYVIAIIYFVVNYLLGLIVKFIERRGPTVERPMEI